MKSVDIVVSGRVQGVGFRAFVKRNAAMLGVKGYVRNLNDGKVHAVLEGDDIQVDKLIELVRHGPKMSRVQGIDITPGEIKKFSLFEVR
jgi:acylphosphatase